MSGYMQGHSHIKTQKRVALFVIVVVAPAAQNNGGNRIKSV